MDEASGRGPARHADGRFGPGNPGRPAGARGRICGRIALGLLNHYAEHEAELLERLSRRHLGDYMRLIGRMLPRGADGGEPQSLPPPDLAQITRAVRAALERVEAGQGSLADIEAALMGLDGGDEP